MHTENVPVPRKDLHLRDCLFDVRDFSFGKLGIFVVHVSSDEMENMLT